MSDPTTVELIAWLNNRGDLEKSDADRYHRDFDLTETRNPVIQGYVESAKYHHAAADRLAAMTRLERKAKLALRLAEEELFFDENHCVVKETNEPRVVGDALRSVRRILAILDGKEPDHAD